MNSDIHPSEKLLDAVQEIAAIRETLPPSKRSLLDSGELHIRSTTLPDGSKEFTVWGLIEYLVFVRATDGSNHVMKYVKADWEAEVYKRLSLYRKLAEDAEVRNSGGSIADVDYKAEKPIHTDSETVSKVKHRTIQCHKCSTKNYLPYAPEPEMKYNCYKCKSFLWQQPRIMWLQLEDFEGTKEEKKLIETLKKTNPSIRKWAEANIELDKLLAGKSPGLLIKIRWFAFLLPIRACVSTSDDIGPWWIWLLTSFGIFGIVTVIDNMWRRYRIRNTMNKAKQIEGQLGGTDRIEAEVEQIYSQWLESSLPSKQKVWFA